MLLSFCRFNGVVIEPTNAVFERDKEQSRVCKEQGRLALFVVFRCIDLSSLRRT